MTEKNAIEPDAGLRHVRRRRREFIPAPTIERSSRDRSARPTTFYFDSAEDTRSVDGAEAERPILAAGRTPERPFWTALDFAI